MVKKMKKSKPLITHSELCEVAAEYARKTLRCGIVLIEHKCMTTPEIVDVAGFRAGVMINIEVKVSRKDFLSDKKKPHRQDPKRGAGDYRLFCAPSGLIQPSDLPHGWGLLEYHEGSGRIKASHCPPLLRALMHPDDYRLRALQQGRDLSQRELETIQYAFEECNQRASMNYLYSAYRQIIQAQEQGLNYQIETIFKRPEGLTFDPVRKMS